MTRRCANVPEDGKPGRSVSRWGAFDLPDTEFRPPVRCEMRMLFEDCGTRDRPGIEPFRQPLPPGIAGAAFPSGRPRAGSFAPPLLDRCPRPRSPSGC
jgi:hypothetical protein